MFKNLGFIFLAVVGVLAWQLFFPPSVSKNYKITVTLEVDGKIQEYSVVQKYELKSPGPLGRGLRLPSKQIVYAEALEMAVPNAPPLYMLVRLRPRLGNSEYYTFFRRSCDLSYGAPGGGYDESLRAYREFDGDCEVTEKLIPAFAVMPDFEDWRSFKYVDPLNLSETYRDGVNLAGVQVEITNERITRKIVGKFQNTAEQRQKTEILIRPKFDMNNIEQYNAEVLNISDLNFFR